MCIKGLDRQWSGSPGAPPAGSEAYGLGAYGLRAGYRLRCPQKILQVRTCIYVTMVWCKTTGEVGQRCEECIDHIEEVAATTG